VKFAPSGANFRVIGMTERTIARPAGKSAAEMRWAIIGSGAARKHRV
jgi:hypothetical protein